MKCAYLFVNAEWGLKYRGHVRADKVFLWSSEIFKRYNERTIHEINPLEDTGVVLICTCGVCNSKCAKARSFKQPCCKNSLNSVQWIETSHSESAIFNGSKMWYGKVIHHLSCLLPIQKLCICWSLFIKNKWQIPELWFPCNDWFLVSYCTSIWNYLIFIYNVAITVL